MEQDSNVVSNFCPTRKNETYSYSSTGTHEGTFFYRKLNNAIRLVPVALFRLSAPRKKVLFFRVGQIRLGCSSFLLCAVYV